MLPFLTVRYNENLKNMCVCVYFLFSVLDRFMRISWHFKRTDVSVRTVLHGPCVASEKHRSTWTMAWIIAAERKFSNIFIHFFFLSRRRHFDSHRSHSFAPAIVPKQCEIVILIVAFVYFGHCSLGRSGAIDSCTSWNGSLYNSIRAVICEIILSTVFLHPNLHTFCQCGRWIERDRVWEKETRD